MDNENKPLYVTQPSLPPLEEFLPYLQKIWDNKILTNGGPFHQELEAALCEYLEVPHVAVFNNGTIALLVAVQALRLQGEVITTPYSFVATAHSLLWTGLAPVFVDIDPRTLNMDPARIEQAITDRTTAIMPVHCYGHPCDVEAIEAIAERHGLRVVYDAAHAFGVRRPGRGVLSFGDLSVLSFHATKVFNTFEGGAIVCRDAAMKKRIDQMKNFGFETETTVVSRGINGKMSEFNAALGLLQLRHLAGALARRRVIDAHYRRALADVPGIEPLPHAGDGVTNFAYFPVMVREAYGATRDELYARLAERRIHARRYFHPLISEFPMYRGLASAAPANLPVAQAAARAVLCLPMSANMTPDDAARVVECIRGGARHA
jgi:dTDP-4-amino-4,6-dideoxygalactose transaminase